MGEERSSLVDLPILVFEIVLFHLWSDGDMRSLFNLRRSSHGCYRIVSGFLDNKTLFLDELLFDCASLRFNVHNTQPSLLDVLITAQCKEVFNGMARILRSDRDYNTLVNSDKKYYRLAENRDQTASMALPLRRKRNIEMNSLRDFLADKVVKKVTITADSTLGKLEAVNFKTCLLGVSIREMVVDTTCSYLKYTLSWAIVEVLQSTTMTSFTFLFDRYQRDDGTAMELLTALDASVKSVKLVNSGRIFGDGNTMMGMSMQKWNEFLKMKSQVKIEDSDGVSTRTIEWSNEVMMDH